MSRHEASPQLVFLLETVCREGAHLHYTTGRLLREPVDVSWVESLEDDPERAERLDAFVARYGRMQDTIGLTNWKWILPANKSGPLPLGSTPRLGLVRAEDNLS